MNRFEASSQTNGPAQETAHEFAPGVDQLLEQQSTLAWLEQRITDLPERQREVLVLSTIKGLSMKEVAGILHLPENTVKTHLRRARLALAESLAARNDADHLPTAAAGEQA